MFCCEGDHITVVVPDVIVFGKSHTVPVILSLGSILIVLQLCERRRKFEERFLN